MLVLNITLLQRAVVYKLSLFLYHGTIHAQANGELTEEMVVAPNSKKIGIR